MLSKLNMNAKKISTDVQTITHIIFIVMKYVHLQLCAYYIYSYNNYAFELDD